MYTLNKLAHTHTHTNTCVCVCVCVCVCSHTRIFVTKDTFLVLLNPISFKINFLLSYTINFS